MVTTQMREAWRDSPEQRSQPRKVDTKAPKRAPQAISDDQARRLCDFFQSTLPGFYHLIREWVLYHPRDPSVGCDAFESERVYLGQCLAHYSITGEVLELCPCCRQLKSIPLPTGSEGDHARHPLDE